jgi:two-component sensor histidine kinase
LVEYYRQTSAPVTGKSAAFRICVAPGPLGETDAHVTSWMAASSSRVERGMAVCNRGRCLSFQFVTARSAEPLAARPDSDALFITAQRGFDDRFVKFFADVRDDASACAAAMRAGQRVVVEDVICSEIFAGKPSQMVLIDAGVRAVISTPLMSSTGNLLGMISTHFNKPHRPSERELHLMDLLARQGADYLERKRAEAVEKTLIREVQHRSNNLLSVVQAVANLTLSGDRSLAKAKKSFEQRLQALARANRELSRSNWSGVNLSEIVQLELKPFADRTIVEGADVMLAHQQAQNLSLALHELATNAAKYGAFSNGDGKLAVSWTTTGKNGNKRLKFKWREDGGPPIVAPTHHGFGTSLLKATFADVRIEYASQGLRCEIDIPLA